MNSEVQELNKLIDALPPREEIIEDAVWKLVAVGATPQEMLDALARAGANAMPKPKAKEA